MSSIRKLYDAKKLTAKRNGASWIVSFTELYMEAGYNIRDGEINAEKVQAFCEAFTTGDYVPAIAVDITEKGLRVNDGQHRYLGAQMAIENGMADVMLEVIDVTGESEGKKVGRMIKANDGTPTSPVARANGYARMKADGMTNDMIAKEVGRSPSDVANFLALAACNDNIKGMVSAGQMSYVMAIEISKEHGEGAEQVATAALEKAKAAGKDKVTKKFTEPKPPKPPKEKAEPAQAPAHHAFGKDKLSRIAELAIQIEAVHDESRIAGADDNESMTLRAPASVVRELRTLLNEYVGGTLE